jgi:hypothetical protein
VSKNGAEFGDRSQPPEQLPTVQGSYLRAVGGDVCVEICFFLGEPINQDVAEQIPEMSAPKNSTGSAPSERSPAPISKIGHG